MGVFSVRATKLHASPALVRSLTLAHATLYGLGVTIGAGIYVLVGAAAAQGGYAMPPLAFMIAAVLMALSAASFAELAGRFPVAAGEAAYARAAFGSHHFGACRWPAGDRHRRRFGSRHQYRQRRLSVRLHQLATAAAGRRGGGSHGHHRCLGIKQSVTFAGIMTVIEIGGLLLLVIAAIVADVPVVTRLPEIIPHSFSASLVAGLIGTVLLAVFAFIGFESLANVAEEVREPHRTLPRAIFLTLLIATLLYVAVVWIALVAVGPAQLARSPAPLALVFERLTGASPSR